MDVLVDKVQRTLRRSDINSSVEKVLNSLRAVLPHDELLGDMLRDGEEIYVVLRGTDGMLMGRGAGPPAGEDQTFVMEHQQASSFADAARYGRSIPMTVELRAPHMDEDSEDELLP